MDRFELWEIVKCITSGCYMSCYITSLNPSTASNTPTTPNTLNTLNTLNELNTSKASGCYMSFFTSFKEIEFNALQCMKR